MSSILASKPKVVFYLSAVFLNAFIDLGHKILIQNTIFKIYDGSQQVILTAIINALILLPYILFFMPAGSVADRFPKHQVMRWVALGAVVLTSFITLFYYLGWFWPAFAMTFLLAVQSAFYFPVKYGYLKGFFGKENLANANGLSQAVAIVAILSGTLVFSLFFEYLYVLEMSNKSAVIQAIAPLGFILIVCSVLEYLAIYTLPNVDRSTLHDTEKTKQKNSSFISNILAVTHQPLILTAIIGLAMFWSVGQVMLAAFPAFAKESLGILNTVVIQGIVATTGLGIAIGSTIAGRVSKNYIELGFIPLGALGISLGLFLLPHLPSSVMMAIDFLWIGMMGGFFIVPLNALVQFYSENKVLGRNLSVSSFIQNVAMFSFLLLTIFFSTLGISSKILLIFIAGVALFGGWYTIMRLPHSMLRYRQLISGKGLGAVSVKGVENLPEVSGAVLLCSLNQPADMLMLQLASPRPIVFLACSPVDSSIKKTLGKQVIELLADSGFSFKSACVNTIKEKLLAGMIVSPYLSSEKEVSDLRSALKEIDFGINCVTLECAVDRMSENKEGVKTAGNIARVTFYNPLSYMPNS